MLPSVLKIVHVRSVADILPSNRAMVMATMATYPSVKPTRIMMIHRRIPASYPIRLTSRNSPPIGYNAGMATSSIALFVIWACIHVPIIATAIIAKRSWTDLLGVSLLMIAPALILNCFLPPWGLVAFIAGHLIVPLLLRFGHR